MSKMLVFNHSEDGDFITNEEILIDTPTKTRIIRSNIEYIESIYCVGDIVSILTRGVKEI